MRTFAEAKYTVVYVCDYTANEQNKDMGRLESPYPSGKMTLKLALWGEQRSFPIESGPGCFYFIRNVRPKLDSEGYLEGMLNGDAGESMCLGRLESTDPEVAELVECVSQSRARCSLTTCQASRGVLAQCHATSSHSAPVQWYALPCDGVPCSRNIIAVVECWHMKQPLYTIAEIKQSELMVAKFRTRARIIEFYPHKLEDFVCRWCRKCEKA